MTRRANPSAIGQIVSLLSRRRKVQLIVLLGCMLVGAVAELVSIGAVLPFLRVLLAPQIVLNDARLAPILQSLGWTTAASLVVPAAILLVVTAIGSAVIRIALNWATMKFIHRVGFDFSSEMYRRTLAQSYQAYVNSNSSETVAGFEKINNVIVFMLLPVMNGLASAVIAVFIVALLILIDPFTAIVAGGAVGSAYVLMTFLSRKSLGRISARWPILIGERVRITQESLGAFRDIMLDRSQPIYQRRFDELENEFRKIAVEGGTILGTPRFVVEATGIALISLLSVYFAGRPGGIVAAIPVLGALALGAQRLIPLLQTVYTAWTSSRSSVDTLKDVVALMTRPQVAGPAIRDVATTRPFREKIAFHDVGFAYADGSSALAGVSLAITRGERIGLIGPTGSGKSTLVDLLMGLLQPTAGTITLDGAVLTQDSAAGWQAQIAHVPQAIFLADASIAANIALGASDTHIDMDRVREAARRAEIHDHVASLPAGYATTVGERGIRLSGGQRQRIGIARALYKQADVLVFDEATSALDDATEASVMLSIDRLDRNLTIIMIAHRLSTLVNCDYIYQLNEVRIARSGSLQDVLPHLVSR